MVIYYLHVHISFKNNDKNVLFLLHLQLYDRVRKLDPDFMQKLIGVVGDCELPGLGLSNEDRQLLIDNVSIIFHAAATVNFDERLSLSLKINVMGTQGVVDICRRVKKLDAFVHVSTAYSNSHLKTTIEEKIYEVQSLGGPEALQLLKMVGDEKMDAISDELVKGYPNTYCFTKNLAEDLIAKEAMGLPVAIFRPAISKFASLFHPLFKQD